jgi:uncharacterized cupin superfamily protein
MSTRRHPNIVNRDEIEAKPTDRGKHRFTRRRFTSAAGNQQLGGSLMEVAPGAISYPFHFHTNNEEAIYVISGSGIARIGEERVPVRAGDWIAHPVGRANAHQMINTGDVPLVYLAIATDHKVEVLGYPDSKKVAAYADDIWTAQREGETLDYWDGEPDA